MKTRKEHDALGEVEVPADSYGGSFYTRAKANFQISSLKAPVSYQKALAWIKMAAAHVNAELGHLPQASAEAIQKAAQAFIEGDFEFDLDVYQAGAGTPFNMHLNEILANRANELLGSKKGLYTPVHPNNHVNMAQSSNDVTPTAIRIAALKDLQNLMHAGSELINALERKALDFSNIVKVGRTHLQDAVPVGLGQEFQAYTSALRHALARLDAARTELMSLGIGGTATGSGINTHPEFAQKMCVKLSELSGLELHPAENRFECTHSLAPLLSVSSSLRALASELIRISDDFRLLSSGPRAGFAELILPEVEPGSSIMPGKVNPSVPECMTMICIQVMGLDHAIALSAQKGELELNWTTPLVMWDLLHQIEILSHGMQMFKVDCVDGLQANVQNIQAHLDASTAMATVLAPHMGYHEVAALVQEALEKDLPFSEVVPAEFKHYLNAKQMTGPNRD